MAIFGHRQLGWYVFDRDMATMEVPVTLLQNWALPVPALLILIALSVCAVGIRVWLLSWIRENVRGNIESRIEGVRGEIRQSEERLKSDLRRRETEIDTLRNRIFDDRAQRQSLVHSRRLLAIERIWNAASNLSRRKMAVSAFANLNTDVVAERAPHDEKLRQFIAISANINQKIEESTAELERPFVNELIWAIYSGYAAVISASFSYLKLMSEGVPEPDKLIKWDYVCGLVASILPNQSDYIAKYGKSGLPHLLDEIENLLIRELKKAVDGDDYDTESIKYSTKIMEQVKKYPY